MKRIASRKELKEMLQLAAPVVLAELGWLSMSIVDTIMVGRLGPEAIGAISLGSSLFLAVAIFGIGLLLGLDTLVSQAHGAGKPEECRRWLVHGVYLSTIITIPLAAFMSLPLWLLDFWGTDPKVKIQAVPYLETLILSMFPLLLYATFRRYLQAQSHVRSVMVALVSANLVNAITNWLLIFGNLGFPALGTTGAGWATLASRVYLAFFLLCHILYCDYRSMLRSGLALLRFETARILQLVQLGLPAALQLTLEVGVFALATALASRLDAISLAAHQIALATASFTFMVPLGISAAGAVRVGQAIGRGKPSQAADAGWTALLLGAGFMLLSAIVFVAFPKVILQFYTSEARVISIGTQLLTVAAVFQVFDGLQVVATGALRGLGVTRAPMVTNLICHWLIGLPTSYVLCFYVGWGVTGLWTGLCVGLITIALYLVHRWSGEIGTFVAQSTPGGNVWPAKLSDSGR